VDNIRLFIRFIPMLFLHFPLNIFIRNKTKEPSNRMKGSFVLKTFCDSSKNYSLIAPDDIPEMKYFWKNRNRIRIGRDPKTLMHIIIDQS